VLGLPLLLLTAFALDALMSRYPRDLDWREAGAVVLTLVILMVSGTLWLTALLANRTYDPVLAQATLVIFGLGLAILVAFAVWANRSDAAWVAAALLTLLLVTVYVRSSWKLNFANVVIEPAGWQATMAHPEVRLLANDIETLSSHRAGDPHELPVQVQVASYVTGDDRVVPARPDPVLGWELRNMRNLTWVTAPLVQADSVPLPLVITSATASDDPAQLDLPDSYAGSRYHVDRWWLPRTLVQQSTGLDEGESGLAQRWALRVQPWWRWMVYRETTEAPRTRDVILWASLDMAIE
jgi:prepilin signal peptidase PulO-like enzyme (type II secretory pathway)